MRYLSQNDILAIHALLIESTGGSDGVRDIALFRSIVARPRQKAFGQEAHRGVFNKAAAYLESIALYHVFVDGNKRTSITVVARFLSLNGYEFSVTNAEMECFVLRVVVEKLPTDDIALWLTSHARKIPKRKKG
ncbi:MAG: type II toxin-antitoxin system death-on-curing family toxin [Patescibacteria group bacterium]|nr:type II toxin-antitoxin system death-on-curing family toxin [Patescibacteria group bacterium]